ncbi:MAG: PEGA domain-containing protein [Candidatus Omnitrophota bacterium]
MQLLRKILFYVFVSIYIVFCPMLLLYAFGYILNPAAKGGVVETGLIYVSTAPPGAAVYLKNSRFKEKTPAVVRDLLPGKYPMRIVLDGYEAWSDDVPVEVKKATVLDDVLLIPEKRLVQRLVAGSFLDLLPVAESGFFFTAGGNGSMADMFICDYEGEKVHNIVRDDSRFREDKLLSYFKSEGSSSVVFIVRSTRGKKILWADLGEGKHSVKEITSLFSAPPGGIKWLSSQPEVLFSLQNGFLNKIDAGNNAVYPEFIKNVKGYGLFDGRVYVLSEDNIVSKTGFDGAGAENILDDPALGDSIFGKGGTFDIRVVSEDLMFFTGENGELLSNRLPYKFLERGVRGVEPDSSGGLILVWLRDKIGILDVGAETTGDVAFEKGPEIRWIYSGGRNIEQCFWVYEDSHVLFRDGSKVYLMAVRPYGAVKIDEVVTVKGRSSVYYSETTGKLYFLERSGGELQSVDIVPVKTVIKSPFPEIAPGNK